MTLSVMLYSLVVAALLSAAALTSERIFAELRLPRRFVWLAALTLSLAVPTYAFLTATSADGLASGPARSTAANAPPAGSATPVVAARESAMEIVRPRYAWPDWHRVSAPLAALWIASSAAICLFHAVSWLLWRRRLGRAEQQHLEGTEVRILEGYGPAVFGFLRPQIILPRWLLDADAALRRIVLCHELEHIGARDQLTLLAALLLVAAAPWNLPLWWQLRRLRAAVEIDCDARVLRSTTSEQAYAEALLEVQQRRAGMPISAVALIEPVTQLERRIRIILSGRMPCKRIVAVTSALAAAALLIAACAVDAPQSALVKPRPPRPMSENAPASPLQELGKIVVARHGAEIRSNDQRIAVVNLFFDESGAFQRSTLEKTDEDVRPTPGSNLDVDQFYVVCLDFLEGAQRCQFDAAKNQTLRSVAIMVYGSPSAPAPTRGSEEIDRRIAERYFASVFSAPPPENTGYWVLLDNGGAILAAGHEVLHTPFSDAGAPIAQIQSALERRYPGTEIEMATVAPIKDRQSRVVTDSAGKNVPLYSGWLSANSPPPAATR